MNKTIKEMINKEIARTGINMSKKISSGGFLSSATYDKRTVYSYKDAASLASEGFTLDGSQSIGTILLNAFMK